MNEANSLKNFTEPAKGYFLKVAPAKWIFRVAFAHYQQYFNESASTICKTMERDLKKIAMRKQSCEESVERMLADIAFYTKWMDPQEPASQPQQLTIGKQVANNINNNNNNNNSLTKNVYHANLDSNNKKRHHQESSEQEPESSTSSSLLLKKAKKSYSMHPPNMTPSISANKPRVNRGDVEKLNDILVVMISPPSSGDSSPNGTRQQYEENMDQQRTLVCLKKKTKVYNLLNVCLNGTLDGILEQLDTNKVVSDDDSDDERQDLRLLRYILLDYHANCSKPSYITLPNERTPFAEYIIPIFKYFSASTRLLSFIWCEKGSPSNKQLMLCLSESQRKLLDGIGFSKKDKTERLLIECSGEEDGLHTEEDTLKLMEYTSNCLKNEMNQYQYASWTTFGRRQIFAVQSIGNKLTLLSTSRLDIGKWCFVEVRSAIVPRDWEDRDSWTRVMELLMKLKEMLLEQEDVTVELKQQQSGRIDVNIKDTIKEVNRSSHAAAM